MLAILALVLLVGATAFRPSTTARRGVLKMEYVPDGMTKEQWQMIKKKEADALKAKGNLGALGTTKFKSRSFEAWQKSGGKHLFPVDPNTASYEERPYMQRKDGDWEGNDLKKKGLKGIGQGASSARNKLDDLYDVAEKEGRLNSASFFGSGLGLDWTGKGKNPGDPRAQFNPEGKQGARAVSAKQLSPEEMERLKKNLAKVTVTKKDSAPAPAAAETKKKGLFGLF